MPVRLGVDLVGGDHAPEKLYAAILEYASELPDDLALVFFVSKQTKERFVVHENCPLDISFEFAEQTLETDKNPLTEIRQKKGTSMQMGFLALKEKRIDALLSIGSTAALIAGARLKLPMIPGIKRPALIALLPRAKGTVAIIDVGGTIEKSAEHLILLAKMGVAFQKCRGIEAPKVALLNIGVEKSKGHQELIKAHGMLKKFDHFCGNIESCALFESDIDLLVTDGFAGNILLKTAEGMAEFAMDMLEKECHQTDIERQTVKKLSHILNYAEYPGAILCGTDALVIKCHGYSNAHACLTGIRGAYQLVKERFVAKLKNRIQL